MLDNTPMGFSRTTRDLLNGIVGCSTGLCDGALLEMTRTMSPLLEKREKDEINVERKRERQVMVYKVLTKF